MEETVKIYEAWQELYDWLNDHTGYDFTVTAVLDKMEELEMKHE